MLAAFALTEPGQGAGGITSFIVPMVSAGVSVSAPYRKLGMRASDTAEITFDGVLLPAGLVIPNR